MATNIRLEGAEELKVYFDKIKDISKIEAGMGKACALVERSAKENAPRGMTGELRRSISSEVSNQGNAVEGKVYSSLLYAPYVEFGTGLFAEKGGRQDVPWHYQDAKGQWHTTSGMSPRPYLRPALESNKDNILQVFKEGLLND